MSTEAVSSRGDTSYQDVTVVESVESAELWKNVAEEVAAEGYPAPAIHVYDAENGGLEHAISYAQLCARAHRIGQKYQLDPVRFSGLDRHQPAESVTMAFHEGQTVLGIRGESRTAYDDEFLPRLVRRISSKD